MAKPITVFFPINLCDYLLHSLAGHALQSTNSTQEATARFLLLPDWLGWSKNGYMTWINDYPKHACVLAKFSADIMLLNPPYRSLVGRFTPVSAQQEENAVQFSSGSTISSRQILKQRGLVTIVPTCLALLVRVKCKNKQRMRLQLLHPDTPIAANISQWQTLHNTNVNQYKSPHIPKLQNWK